jgi:hypothetical protein
VNGSQQQASGESFISLRLGCSFSSYTLNHPLRKKRKIKNFILFNQDFCLPSSLQHDPLVAMVMDSGNLLSAVVFGPQSKEPKPEYLVRIRDSLYSNEDLAPFITAISELPKLWAFFQSQNRDAASLTHGLQGLQALADWISTGASSWICKATHAMVALPLLGIIQVTQYFEYLSSHRIRHRDVIRMTKKGAGIQGYCSGFFMAAALATSEDEIDLVQKASNALRLAVAVGLYSDLATLNDQHAQGTMVIHLKSPGQLDEILTSYPKVRETNIKYLRLTNEYFLDFYFRYYGSKDHICCRARKRHRLAQDFCH